MATKRARGGHWQFTVRRAGLLPKPIYLTFDDEAEGDAYVARLEAALDRGEVPPEYLERPRGESLGRVVRGYLREAPVSAGDTVILGGYLGRSERVDQVGYRWAEGIVRGLQEARRAPGTIRHHVGALARCLDWAVRRGDMAANPLRLLPRGYATYRREDPKRRVDQERDRRLAPEEEAAIRAVLDGLPTDGPEMRLLFELALETAMRMSEMTGLEVHRIDLDARTVFLERTKSGRRRQVPLSSVAVRVLKAYLEEMPERAMLFPWLPVDASVRTIRREVARRSNRWARIFARAGCPDLRFHDLRHEATSRLFERTTLSDLEIAKITGHRDPRMLARYANLRASTLADRLW